MSRVRAVARDHEERRVVGAFFRPRRITPDRAARRGPDHARRSAVRRERDAHGARYGRVAQGDAHQALDGVEAALHELSRSVQGIDEDLDLGRGEIYTGCGFPVEDCVVERNAELVVFSERRLVLLSNNGEARPRLCERADDGGLRREVGRGQRRLGITGDLKLRVEPPSEPCTEQMRAQPRAAASMQVLESLWSGTVCGCSADAIAMQHNAAASRIDRGSTPALSQVLL